MEMSPVKYKWQKRNYEVEVNNSGRVETHFVFPATLKHGDTLPTLTINGINHFKHTEAVFRFCGIYVAKTDNLRFFLEGPPGYVYKASLQVDEPDGTYSWKLKRHAHTNEGKTNGATMFFVPRTICLTNDSIVIPEVDVIRRWSFYGPTVPERFGRLRLKMELSLAQCHKNPEAGGDLGLQRYYKLTETQCVNPNDDSRSTEIGYHVCDSRSVTDTITIDLDELTDENGCIHIHKVEEKSLREPQWLSKKSVTFDGVSTVSSTSSIRSSFASNASSRSSKSHKAERFPAILDSTGRCKRHSVVEGDSTHDNETKRTNSDGLYESLSEDTFSRCEEHERNGEKEEKEDVNKSIDEGTRADLTKPKQVQQVNLATSQEVADNADASQRISQDQSFENNNDESQKVPTTLLYEDTFDDREDLESKDKPESHFPPPSPLVEVRCVRGEKNQSPNFDKASKKVTKNYNQKLLGFSNIHVTFGKGFAPN